ncbi:RNA recognition motif domain-containing protein [Sarocladium implicatum]|nr:RNA recognition motif domain-containing protein [Sarocladium implicatum]
MADEIIWATPQASKGLQKSASEEVLTGPAEKPIELEDGPGGAALTEVVLSPQERAPRKASPEGTMVLQAYDAQAHYPVSYGLYVGNLPNDLDKDTLERMVLHVFQQFGTVFPRVTINRERNPDPLPNCYIQFTRREDCERALRQGAGLLIGGRPCRLERCQGDTVFEIRRRRARVSISVSEAVDVMGRLGEIEQAHHIRDDPCVVMVRYVYRDVNRNPVKAFENDPTWRVIKSRVKEQTATGRGLPANDWQIQYERNSRTAWFGKMPHTFNEEILRSFASEVGQVLHIDFRPSRDLPDGSPSTCFAFVEFSQAHQVDAAMQLYHGCIYDGRKLKVERRRTPGEATPQRTLRDSHARQPFTTSPSTRLPIVNETSPGYGPLVPAHPTSRTPMSTPRPPHSGLASARRAPRVMHARGSSVGSPSRGQQGYYRPTPSRGLPTTPRQVPSPRHTHGPPMPPMPLLPPPPQPQFTPMMPHGELPYGGDMFSVAPGYGFPLHPHAPMSFGGPPMPQMPMIGAGAHDRDHGNDNDNSDVPPVASENISGAAIGSSPDTPASPEGSDNGTAVVGVDTSPIAGKDEDRSRS